MIQKPLSEGCGIENESERDKKKANDRGVGYGSIDK